VVLEADPVRGIHPAKTGEFIHLRCRSQQLHLMALDEGDRASLAIERATDLVQETRRLRSTQPTRLTARRDRCPVCGGRATLVDWRPHLEWPAVDGCPCGGYFVWTPLLDEGRLTWLTPEDRGSLSERLWHLRATQSEAWLSTREGTVMGALIIRSERPDPTGRRRHMPAFDDFVCPACSKLFRSGTLVLYQDGR